MLAHLSAENLCKYIIKMCENRDEGTFTSWYLFAEFLDRIPEEDLRSFNSLTCGQVQGKMLRAVVYGKKRGWLEAYWCGVGLTPWAGSARRQRMYHITDKAKSDLKDFDIEQLSQ